MTLTDELNMHFADIYSWDRLGNSQSVIHRLDPRAKLLVTCFFIVIVMSFDKYSLSSLLPFLLFPVAMSIMADIPTKCLAKRLLLISPFALLIGIFNPFLDRTVISEVGPLQITGGWFSFLSIMLRFLLTASAALILLTSTGIYRLCLAMQAFGVPRVLVVQLLLLYRYIFVLLDDASRLLFARSSRAFGRRGLGLRVYCHILAGFMIRTIDRAGRIYNAMKSRGFSGEIHIGGTLRWQIRDTLFVMGWCGFFVLARVYNLPVLATRMFAGGVGQ